MDICFSKTGGQVEHPQSSSKQEKKIVSRFLNINKNEIKSWTILRV